MMRCLRMHLLIVALTPLAWGSGSAEADWWPYTETVYTSPGSLAFVPTSYVVPSSYLVPTTSVVPTVYATAYYAETSAWMPTAYVETAYVPTSTYYVRERVARRPLFSRPLFGRRRDYIVPTTIYYPTTTVVPTTARYYAPTVLEYPVLSDVRYQSVASSCGTCDDSVVVASAPAPQVERRVVRDEESAPRVEETPRRSAVESDALDDSGTTSSKVQPPPPEPEPADLSPVQKPAPSQTKPSRVETTPTQSSPPIAPAASATTPSPSVRSSAQPQPDSTKSNTNKPADTQPEGDLPPPATLPKQEELSKPGDIDLPPVAPSSPTDADLPVNDKSAPKSRESLKPVLELPRPSGLTLLKGRVRSSASAEPEKGVQVTVSSRTNAFEDRTARSNESGKFAMRVPDGDWTVKVTMPSGRVYPVYRITVSGGVIVDDQGRDIPALVIDR